MLDLSIYNDKFIDYCRSRKNLSTKTLTAYTTDLKQLWEYTGGDLSKASICSYLAYLHDNYKPKTYKRKIATMKAYIHFLLVEDLIDADPFSKIDTSYREPVILPKTLPLDIIESVINSAYTEYTQAKTPYTKRIALRNAAVLEMLFATGARVSEVCSLLYDNVDLTEHRIKIYGKGSRERIIQIENPAVLNILSEYCQLFHNSGEKRQYFFLNKYNKRLSEQSVREMIHKYADLSGCRKHITPHMFRHSFATLLLEEDVDIRYIQNILGHSSITTTQIYTHVAMSKQKEILLAKHPRNKINI